MFPFSTPPKPKPKQPQPLDLHIPRGWNELTTAQLETLCKLLIDTARHDSENPQAPTSRATFLTRALFAITGLEPISDLQYDDTTDGGETPPPPLGGGSGVGASPLSGYFSCQYSDPTIRAERQTFNGQIIPIRIYVSDVIALSSGYDSGIDKQTDEPIHVPGAIEWLLSPSRLTKFPYPELTINGKVYHGPSYLMSDVSWRQYRFATNMLSDIVKGENALIKMKQNLVRNPGSYKACEALEQQIKMAHAQWLANLFTLPVTHIDSETQQSVTRYFYTSDQYERYAKDFLDIPDYQYQAISLWWQGMMEHLARVYPKVFHRDSPKNNALPTDALTSYTRSTATLMKYIGGSEDEVNRTQYTIILQHIQDMADENDRVKEMRKKK